jgi:hypothetical protein
MADLSITTTGVLSIIESFRALIFLDEQVTLEALLASSDRPSSALRLRSLYSDYQAQFKLLLATLTKKYGLTIDSLKQNPDDVHREELLGKSQFDQLEKSISQVTSKLRQFIKAATIKNDSPQAKTLKIVLGNLKTGDDDDHMLMESQTSYEFQLYI